MFVLVQCLIDIWFENKIKTDDTDQYYMSLKFYISDLHEIYCFNYHKANISSK